MRYRNYIPGFQLKSTLLILILLNLSSKSYCQDSLFASKVDSMVRLTEDKIINLGQHMFIRNKIVDLWHQEYIIDTINKKLLRVRTYFQICDTFVVDSHDPTRPLSFKTACGSMAYTFFLQ